MNYILESLFIGPAHCAYSGRGGVTGLLTDQAEKISSFVAVVAPEEIPTELDIVDFHVKTLKERNQPFSWITEVGREESIRAHLESQSFHPVFEMYGLEVDILSSDFEHTVSDEICVEEIEPIKLLDYLDLIASSYGCSHKYATQRISRYRFPEAGRMRGYIAYHKAQGPAGFSLMIELSNLSIAKLSLACVLPQARGNGVYRAMYSKRLRDAKKSGMTKAITYGNASRSANLLENFGMQKRGHFVFNGSPWGV